MRYCKYETKSAKHTTEQSTCNWKMRGKKLKPATRYSGDFPRTQIQVKHFQLCSYLCIQIAGLSAFKSSWLHKLCKHGRAVGQRRQTYPWDLWRTVRKAPLPRKFIHAYPGTTNPVHSWKGEFNVVCHKTIIWRLCGFPDMGISGKVLSVFCLCLQRMYI